MLYLFSSIEFGQPFIREAARFATENGVDLTVILSGRWPRNVPPTRWRRLKKRLRDAQAEISSWRRYGVRFQIVENVNTDTFRRQSHGAHGIAASFNQIFRKETIAGFQSLVNIHASILPYYRGPNPLHWCLVNREVKTGYTIHQLSEQVDAGRALHQEIVPIAANADTTTLAQNVAESAARVLPRYLAHLVYGTPWNPELVDVENVYQTRLDYAPHLPRA